MARTVHCRWFDVRSFSAPVVNTAHRIRAVSFKKAFCFEDEKDEASCLVRLWNVGVFRLLPSLFDIRGNVFGSVASIINLRWCCGIHYRLDLRGILFWSRWYDLGVRVAGIKVFFGLYSCKYQASAFWNYLLYETYKMFGDDIMSSLTQFRSGLRLYWGVQCSSEKSRWVTKIFNS